MCLMQKLLWLALASEQVSVETIGLAFSTIPSTLICHHWTKKKLPVLTNYLTVDFVNLLSCLLWTSRMMWMTLECDDLFQYYYLDYFQQNLLYATALSDFLTNFHYY